MKKIIDALLTIAGCTAVVRSMVVAKHGSYDEAIYFALLTILMWLMLQHRMDK